MRRKEKIVEKPQLVPVDQLPYYGYAKWKRIVKRDGVLMLDVSLDKRYWFVLRAPC